MNQERKIKIGLGKYVTMTPYQGVYSCHCRYYDIDPKSGKQYPTKKLDINFFRAYFLYINYNYLPIHFFICIIQCHLKNILLNLLFILCAGASVCH